MYPSREDVTDISLATNHLKYVVGSNRINKAFQDTTTGRNYSGCFALEPIAR
jgi:hypothetical protein